MFWVVNIYYLVSDENLLLLFNYFGSVFEKSIELYESKHVTKITSETDDKNTNIYFLRVKTSEFIYTVFPGVNYCSCDHFR